LQQLQTGGSSAQTAFPSTRRGRKKKTGASRGGRIRRTASQLSLI
jgi:hypothetical protein